MTNRIFIVLIISVLIFCTNSCKSPNDKNSTTTDTLIVENQENTIIDTVKTTEFSVPQKIIFNKINGDNLADKFLPIGWSSNGYFAFTKEYVDEACFCNSISLTIVDSDENTITCDWKYVTENKKETLSEMWYKNIDTITYILNTYEIIAGKNFALKPTRFIYQNNEYVINLESEKMYSSEYQHELITKTIFYLNSAQNKKIISTEIETQPSQILGAFTPGFIQSADNKYIAIIHHKERRGYEGPPHVSTFSVVCLNMEMVSK